MSDRIKKTIEQYNKIAYRYAQNIASRQPSQEIERFIKLLKPHDKILDVGCAAGRDCRIFKNKGFEIVGIDLSEKLLKIAKQNNPDIEFKVADFRKLPFPDDSFNGLWVNTTFHHLDRKDMLPTLKDFIRVLANNGILFIRTKLGKGNIKVKEDLALNEERGFTLLTQTELEIMVSKVGFEKIGSYISKDKTRDLYWINLFCRNTTQSSAILGYSHLKTKRLSNAFK